MSSAPRARARAVAERAEGPVTREEVHARMGCFHRLRVVRPDDVHRFLLGIDVVYTPP